MRRQQRAHLSLSERSADFLHVSTPIHFEQSSLDKAMKTAVRPICNARDMPVFDGIELNVIDVSLKIGLIADRVLPIAPLPNSFLAFNNLARRARSRLDSPREAAFDERPSGGKVCISIGQGPDSVEVIRKNANCNGLKWPSILNESVGRSQTFDFFNEQCARAINENDREKERDAFGLYASIVRHDHLHRA